MKIHHILAVIVFTFFSEKIFSAAEEPDENLFRNHPVMQLENNMPRLEFFSSETERYYFDSAILCLSGFYFDPNTAVFSPILTFTSMCQYLTASYFEQDLNPSRYAAILIKADSIMRFSKTFLCGNSLSATESFIFACLPAICGILSIFCEHGSNLLSEAFKKFMDKLYPMP